MPKKPKYYVRPDGLHEAIMVIDGKRVAFRGKSDPEVERKMIEFRERREKGRPFREVADEWSGIHFPTLAPNTLKGYRPALRRAVEEFGDDSIREIRPPDIKRFINEFSRGGKAQKTVTNQLLLTSLVFDYAVSEGEIEYNPCTSVSPPKGLQRGHRDAASPEDEKRVKAGAKVWLLPYLILYTGLRKGEALALTFDDIDREARMIRVTKSVYHEGTQPRIKKPKTAAGVRTVPIFDPLWKELPVGKGNRYIFSADGGKTPLKHDVYNAMWEEFAEKTGISCTAHQLRHSYATMLFEMDVDAKVAQELLGHSTEAMTREIYTHLRQKKLDDTTREINRKLREMETAEVQGNTQKRHRKTAEH